ncbi:hypothetical protein RBA41_29550 [Massilia sp. CCM 9210]|uniref:hypothetical protein n=1 Tax=Massilia scottii TaxID=3057166 RepID=UPI0027967613|nr:hypothetical protein [Massilia sp. CCM 9210]MDQ1817458.1 hypothetical protein [Massilia sp. CCM 9210]
MAKHRDLEDPLEFETFARVYFNISDETVDAYLFRNGITEDTALGILERLKMALAWIELEATSHSQSVIDTMKSLVAAHEIASPPLGFITTVPISGRREITQFQTEEEQYAAAKAVEARFQQLFEQAINLHRLQPSLDASEKYRKEQSARASTPRKLTEAECRRIARQYCDSKADGTSWGVVKRLANQYKVSATTIHNVVKKYDPNKIDK